MLIPNRSIILISSLELQLWITKSSVCSLWGMFSYSIVSQAYHFILPAIRVLGLGAQKYLSILSSSISYITLVQILLESLCSDFGFQQHKTSLLGSWCLLWYFLMFLHVSNYILGAVIGLELPNRPGLWLHLAPGMKLSVLWHSFTCGARLCHLPLGKLGCSCIPSFTAAVIIRVLCPLASSPFESLK